MVTPCLVCLWTAISWVYSTHVGLTISTDLRNAAVHLYKHHVKSLRRLAALLGNQLCASGWGAILQQRSACQHQGRSRLKWRLLLTHFSVPSPLHQLRALCKRSDSICLWHWVGAL